MDKKLKKDFQKKIIRNRDAPEKNMDSKLVHSDDYTNKIIKTKDRFGDKISEKESKLIHENVLAKDQKQDKLKDFQKSKNKERIRKEVLDNKDKAEETKQANLEIRTDESFKLDNVSVCHYSEGYYYCGLSEKYTYSIGGEPHTYRTIKNSYKKDDKLIIYDYFLKVINDECYTSFMTNDKNDKCSKKYDNKKNIDYNFMKRYGKVYKHTFQKDGNNYYWVSSEAE